MSKPLDNFGVRLLIGVVFGYIFATLVSIPLGVVFGHSTWVRFVGGEVAVMGFVLTLRFLPGRRLPRRALVRAERREGGWRGGPL